MQSVPLGIDRRHSRPVPSVTYEERRRSRRRWTSIGPVSTRTRLLCGLAGSRIVAALILAARREYAHAAATRARDEGSRSKRCEEDQRLFARFPTLLFVTALLGLLPVPLLLQPLLGYITLMLPTDAVSLLTRRLPRSSPVPAARWRPSTSWQRSRARRPAWCRRTALTSRRTLDTHAWWRQRLDASPWTMGFSGSRRAARWRSGSLT
jgi:hypothetical protein